MAELDFAREKGAAYTLYRVFSACSCEARIVKLQNVSRSIKGGGLVLFAGTAAAD